VCEKYNGWKNYPSWAVALWIDAEPTDAEATRAYLKAHGKEDTAKWLRSSYALCAASTKANMVGDLLGWAFEQVDWMEVVKHYAD